MPLRSSVESRWTLGDRPHSLRKSNQLRVSMTNPPTSIRTYEVHAETTRTFGRVLTSARQHHLVVDGPVQNGCPGEEVTPAELFLGGVAACGAELIQVIAREEGV